MPVRIRPVTYVHATVPTESCGACEALTELAHLGVNLLAFSAIPQGAMHTQLVMFPEDLERLRAAAEHSGIALTDPQKAFLVQGKDEVGAIARIHAHLRAADIHVYAATGVTDGHGGFGYIIYVRPEEFERAAQSLTEFGDA